MERRKGGQGEERVMRRKDRRKENRRGGERREGEGKFCKYFYVFLRS